MIPQEQKHFPSKFCITSKRCDDSVKLGILLKYELCIWNQKWQVGSHQLLKTLWLFCLIILLITRAVKKSISKLIIDDFFNGKIDKSNN